LGTVGDKEIEEERRNDCPLRNAAVDFTGFGAAGVVGAGGRSTAEVGGEPADEVVMEGG